MSIIAPEPFEYLPENGASYLAYTDFAHRPVNRNRLHCVVEMSRDSGKAPDDLVEIGCGLGNIAIPLASLGGNVTAIDIHEPSVEEARRRNKFANLDIKHLSLQDIDLAQFDVVVLSEVLEHVVACDEMMATICSGIKKGAKLVVTMPNGWNFAEIMCRPSYRLKHTHIGGKIVKKTKRILGTKDLSTADQFTPHVHFFTLGRLFNLFAANGMKLVRFRRSFLIWLFVETFFSERNVPEIWAEKDFYRSQQAHPAFCALWAFELEKL